jgi:hypothetical protein
MPFCPREDVRSVGKNTGIGELKSRQRLLLQKEDAKRRQL